MEEAAPFCLQREWESVGGRREQARRTKRLGPNFLIPIFGFGTGSRRLIRQIGTTVGVDVLLPQTRAQEETAGPVWHRLGSEVT